MRQKGAEVSEKLLPKIITFDARTGLALERQDERPDAKVKEDEPQLRLPWRAWHSNAVSYFLGQKEAAMRSALLVLQMLQAKVVYDGMPIDVWFDQAKGTKRVVATEPILAKSLDLPPCVVKCKTLSEESVHAHRVPIRVAMIVLQQPSDPAAAVAESSDPAAAVAESSDPAAAVAAKRKLPGKRKTQRMPISHRRSHRRSQLRSPNASSGPSM